jgi:hypothetical protein
MDLNSISNSKFLAKGDVGRGILAVIAGFSFEEFDGEKKLIMSFVTAGVKPMVVNKINRNRLIDALQTSDSSLMIGRQVVIYCDDTVEFGGRVVGGLRIRAPRPQATPEPELPTPAPISGPDRALRDSLRSPAAPAASVPPAAFDDDIPF